MKTTIVGKKGKTEIRTPLSVNNALRNHALQANVECANQPSSVQTERNENMLLLDACDSTDIAQDDIAITSNQREIASSSNWAKIRDALLTARIGDAAFPENSICVVCNESMASVRCEYCGPRQYFCFKCA